MMEFKKQKAFMIAEVLATSGTRGKICSHSFSRASVVRGLLKQKFAFSGFTLAEVLITLAIIGVVAALTIPTVVKNYQIKQTVTQLKKAHSQLSQAYNMAQIDNGFIQSWDIGLISTPEGANKIIDILKPYLKIDKICGTNFNLAHGCFFEGDYKTLKNTTMDYHPGKHHQYSSLRLVDGSSLSIYSYGNNMCRNDGLCVEIRVDVNGPKPPNVAGRDLFQFEFRKNGVTPNNNIESWCSLSSTNNANGVGCTAWVIHKENMDYLHKEVSW